MSRNEKPKKSFDYFTNKQLNEWVLEKLEDEPLYYGGDIGNPAIMKVYLEEVHNVVLPLEALSACASVSRRKNKILEFREDLDFREVYAIDRNKEKDNPTKPFPNLLDDYEK